MPEQSRSGQEITPAAMTRLGVSTSAGRIEAETNKAGSVPREDSWSIRIKLISYRAQFITAWWGLTAWRNERREEWRAVGNTC